MRKRCVTTTESQRGMSLIEMMAACLVISFVGAAIAGLMMLNGISEIKMSNKVDGLNAARTALERVARDIRMARNVGDMYGQVFKIGTDQNNGPIYGFAGANDFPSQSGSQNLLYPNYVTPPSGWPWGGQPYTLSEQTLILQIPVFDSNGFPTALPAGFGSPPLPANEDNLDTIVYNVVPDPAAPGTYMLQRALFPGWTSPPYSGSNPSPPPSTQPNSLIYDNNPPQTVLRGIVGPLDPNGSNPGVPACFQYIDKTQPMNPPLTGGTPAVSPMPAGADNANLTGVIVQFQVRNTQTGSTAPGVVSLKTEVYARNNSLQTVTATADEILQSGS